VPTQRGGFVGVVLLLLVRVFGVGLLPPVLFLLQVGRCCRSPLWCLWRFRARAEGRGAMCSWLGSRSFWLVSRCIGSVHDPSILLCRMWCSSDGFHSRGCSPRISSVQCMRGSRLSLVGYSGSKPRDLSTSWDFSLLRSRGVRVPVLATRQKSPGIWTPRYYCQKRTLSKLRTSIFFLTPLDIVIPLASLHGS
jgi:hypothetical protein